MNDEKKPVYEIEFRFNLSNNFVLNNPNRKLKERAQDALRMAQFSDNDKCRAIEEKMRHNPELQQIVCDLLEPFYERFEQARNVLESDMDTRSAYLKALEILELKTPGVNRKRNPKHLLWEYISLVYDKKNAGQDQQAVKWAAIDFLNEKYKLHKISCDKKALREESDPGLSESRGGKMRGAVSRELSRQLKAAKDALIHFEVGKILPGDWEKFDSRKEYKRNGAD